MFDISQVGQQEKERLQALIAKNAAIFAVDKTDLGRWEAIKHRIHTGDAPPVYRRAYRIPFSKTAEMKEQVDALIRAGIIDHSTPWGALALLVEKPDGSYRLVVDDRDINKVTRVEPYPLPNIHETLAHLGKATYFTVVDMPSGCWQIHMDPRDKDKTAFNTPFGHF